ncbi:oligosaccharide flippase family protein [Sporolactobacillus inulinus]|uniref:oligosaccharide flippase family protein n=1 Tax=Sporolactobacillus inulinus TaxID=2078 RepID=UPI0021CD08E5|nr:polysaccharide biosynthesis C-terminal domain-containing protein [Sporolactobacillus inulinus]
MSYSINSLVNNGISQTAYLLDLFMLGIFISNSLILASYKTATIIPYALTFIPASIMIFMYPYIAQKQDDKKWILMVYKRMLFYLTIFNVFLVGLSEILAPYIIKIIFGSDYMNAVPYFRVLMLGYLFDGIFRTTSGGILAMIKKIKPLILINTIGGLINITLDYILIKRLGMLGAALTSLIVLSFTAFLYTVVLVRYLRRHN